MTDRSLLPPGRPEDVLNFVGDGSQLVVPLALGEPPTLIKTLEDNCERFTGVRIHQMDPLQSHRYIRGEFGDRLRHVCYYLGPGSRQAYWDGTCDLVPNHFSEMPLILRRVKPDLVLARAAGASPARRGPGYRPRNSRISSQIRAQVRWPRTLRPRPRSSALYGMSGSLEGRAQLVQVLYGMFEHLFRV